MVIDSFRHAFINRIRRELPAGIVTKLARCKFFEVMEHYNKRVIDEFSAGLAGANTARKNF
jgi:hypothetical protein